MQNTGASAPGDTPPAQIADHSDVLVIGGGQAALSAAYFLHRFGLGERYQVLDHAPGPGGAWQFRWPSLTLATANRVHDLPGWGIVDALGLDCDHLPAATAVPDYFGRYEARFGLNVHRPVHVRSVRRDGDGFRAELGDGRSVTADVIVNATGTWDRPFIPHIPGRADFSGRQLHTHDYRSPAEFTGQRVLVVGAGISAIQLLIAIARKAPGVETFWCSRREPVFDPEPFTPEQGREAVARVERRVRAGLPPTSVVSVTGLALTPTIAAFRRDGILQWRPMFTRITETGVCWGLHHRRRRARTPRRRRHLLEHRLPLCARPPCSPASSCARRRHRHDRTPRDRGRGRSARPTPGLRPVGVDDRRQPGGREAARVAAELLGVR